jgi:DinB superfamily
MSAESLIKTLMISRGYFQNQMSGLSDEQLLLQPEGATNNILWHLGHIAHSHNSMVYKACGLDGSVPDSWADLFKGGTSPADWPENPPVEEVKERFKNQMNEIVADYQAGKFADFNKIELTPQIALENIDESLGFVVIHESVHIGLATAVKQKLG